MPDLAEVRAAYRLEYGRYARLADWAKNRLADRLALAPVYAPTLDARSKDVVSFVRKAIRGGYADPLSQITDKAGVRVLVSLLTEVSEVERVIAETFTVIEHQDKAAELDPDQLGYLGVHFLVTPRADDVHDEFPDLEDAVCEIQIHTRAWASINHPLIYKPAGPSSNIIRRVNRLVALVELFDQEVAAAREAVMNEPGYGQAAMLQTLEKEFLLLAHRDFDASLSLAILEAIAPAYSETELAQFDQLIHDFAQQHRADLVRVFEQNAANDDADPLALQPEAIAILERLHNAKERLRATWDQTLPSKLLDSLSEELGRPA